MNAARPKPPLWLTAAQFVLFAVIVWFATHASGATLVVQPGQPVPAATSGDTIVFAAGDHNVSVITLRSGVMYRGATGNRGDVRLHGATGNCTGAQATMCATSVNGVTIRDLTIDNLGAVGNGIVISGTSSNVLISNVHVTNIGLSPIVIGQVVCTGGVPCNDLSSAPSNITISDVEVSHGGQTGNGHGVFVRSCRSGVVLLDVRAHHMGTTGDPDGVHATNCPGLRITGGEFFANAEEGIDLSRTASNGNGCNDYMSGVCNTSGARCRTDNDCGAASTCMPWIIEGARSFGNGVGGGGSGAVKVTSCAHAGVIRNNQFDQNLQLDACPHDIAIIGNRLGGLSLFGNNYGITVEGNTIQCASGSACVRVARGDANGLHTSVVTSNEWRNNVLGNVGTGSAFSTGFSGVTSLAEYPSATGPRCAFTSAVSSGRTYATSQLAQFKADAIFGPGTGDGDVWVVGPPPTTTSTTTSTSTSSTTSTTADPWTPLGKNVWTRKYRHDGYCDMLYTTDAGGLALGVCE